MIWIYSQDGLIKEHWAGRQKPDFSPGSTLLLASQWKLVTSLSTLAMSHLSCQGAVMPGLLLFRVVRITWDQVQGRALKLWSIIQCETLFKCHALKRKPSVLADSQRKAHRLGFCISWATLFSLHATWQFDCLTWFIRTPSPRAI